MDRGLRRYRRRHRLAQARLRVDGKDRAEFRRVEIDVTIQAGLGRFFASKFRGRRLLYRIYQQTGDRTALEESVNAYRKARASWAELSNGARGVYLSDITVGELPQLHGHWLDRLPALDQDIDALAVQLAQAKYADADPQVRAAIQEVLGRPSRRPIAANHTPPTRFHPGQPLDLELSMEQPASSVHLFYRHVTHAERFENVAMLQHDHRFSGAIPAAYTGSAYPLQYYFEVRGHAGRASLFPGFAAELNNQPYYVVRRA